MSRFKSGSEIADGKISLKCQGFAPLSPQTLKNNSQYYFSSYTTSTRGAKWVSPGRIVSLTSQILIPCSPVIGIINYYSFYIVIIPVSF
uniref:Uncharacterized protein n=1 Tax=Strongyloides papillosus TaxID=174720 RepID=A0A0N5CFK4_STREA